MREQRRFCLTRKGRKSRNVRGGSQPLSLAEGASHTKRGIVDTAPGLGRDWREREHLPALQLLGSKGVRLGVIRDD